MAEVFNFAIFCHHLLTLELLLIQGLTKVCIYGCLQGQCKNNFAKLKLFGTNFSAVILYASGDCLNLNIDVEEF